MMIIMIGANGIIIINVHILLWAQFPAFACKSNVELTIVVSVLGLDCAQHSSRIAPLDGDRDPLEEELEGTRLPCFCLEAMSQFVEELQGLWATDT